jgi:hypothetical protein
MGPLTHVLQIALWNDDDYHTFAESRYELKEYGLAVFKSSDECEHNRWVLYNINTHRRLATFGSQQEACWRALEHLNAIPPEVTP